MEKTWIFSFRCYIRFLGSARQQLMQLAKFLILTLIGKKKFSHIGIIYKVGFL